MRRSSLLFGSDNHPTEAFAHFLRDVQVPGDDLPSIDSALQARFFQKNPDGSPKERWELDKVQVNCPPERIKQHLAACGFLNETKPSANEYTYAAWPGALVTRAVIRLNDLVNAWQNGIRWQQTIVFGGKRPLQPDKESYEECCKAMRIHPEHYQPKQSWEAQPPTNELEMMRWVCGNTMQPFSQEKITVPPVFVDAPMKPPSKEGGLPVRPTTEDTVLEWLRSNPKPGSVLLCPPARLTAWPWTRHSGCCLNPTVLP